MSKFLQFGGRKSLEVIVKIEFEMKKFYGIILRDECLDRHPIKRIIISFSQNQEKFKQLFSKTPKNIILVTDLVVNSNSRVLRI